MFIPGGGLASGAGCLLPRFLSVVGQVGAQKWAPHTGIAATTGEAGQPGPPRLQP